VQKAQQVSGGFLEIQKQAQQFAVSHTVEDNCRAAVSLLASESHQARSLATFILGFIAAESGESLDVLRRQVGRDEDWRVQEILAKAFDRYCADAGYEKTLPVIRDWLADDNPNVRRAVTEGLRIWTGREYFKDNPGVAIQLLSGLKDDESEYVRKSVGNALKDISKKHKEMVKAETDGWDLTDKRIKYTYRYASKYL
jgi:3-methyladenine DNA glycosylase AlkC